MIWTRVVTTLGRTSRCRVVSAARSTGFVVNSKRIQPSIAYRFRASLRFLSYEVEAPTEKCMAADASTAITSNPDATFDVILEEVAALRIDTTRISRLTSIIRECLEREEWVNLVKLGLFLLSSPDHFCHHSCLLIATALSMSPHPHEAMEYMQELAARNIVLNQSCLVKLMNSFIKMKDVEALSNAILTLSKLNVFVFSDIVEYAFLQCLRREAYEEAYSLLDILEHKAGSTDLKRAYINLSELDPIGAQARIAKMKAVGVQPTPLQVLHMLNAGNIQEATHQVDEYFRLNINVNTRSVLYRRLFAELIKVEKCLPVRHGKWSAAERLVWGIVRHNGCNHIAFEEAMHFWSSIASDLVVEKPRASITDTCNGLADVVSINDDEVKGGITRSDLADDKIELYDMYLRRRREVLFDMARAGVVPNTFSFKTALRFAPPVNATRDYIVSEMRQMNINGEFKTLAGLWGGIMIACDVKPFPPLQLVEEIIRDNISSAIDNTDELISLRDMRPFRRRLVSDSNGIPCKDSAGNELFRYDIKLIEDGVVQYAWTQLLSEIVCVAKRAASPQRPADKILDNLIGDYFVVPGSMYSLWLDRADFRRMTFDEKVLRNVRTPRPPRWFFERSGRVFQNPLVMAESFALVLKYYATINDNKSFFEVADFMVENRYLDLTGLTLIKERCFSLEKMDTYHGVVVELAEGLCDVKRNPLGAKLLENFKNTSPFFDCKDLQQRWRDMLAIAEGGSAFDGLFTQPFAESLEYFAEKLRERDSLTAAQKVEYMDKVATIVIAQKTNGLQTNWKSLSSVIPGIFLPKQRRMFNAAYVSKLLCMGKLIVSTEHYEKRVQYKDLLYQFQVLNRPSPFEQLWNTDSEFCAMNTKVEHIVDIMKIRCSAQVADYSGVCDVFETALLHRGDMFAYALLKESGALNMFLLAHSRLISDALKANDNHTADVVAREMNRLERVLNKISSLNVLVGAELVSSAHQIFRVDKIGPQTPVELLWSIFIFVEKVLAAIEKLPPSSVPISPESVAQSEIDAIITAFNANPYLHKNRASVKVAEMTSIYPQEYVSIKNKFDILHELHIVMEKLSWLISPKERLLFDRFATFKTRLERIR